MPVEIKQCGHRHLSRHHPHQPQKVVEKCGVDLFRVGRAANQKPGTDNSLCAVRYVSRQNITSLMVLVEMDFAIFILDGSLYTSGGIVKSLG